MLKKINLIMDKNRNKNLKMCTDILWLGLFLAFVALLILIAVISINHSSYQFIVQGHDSFGNICGLKNTKHFDNFPESGVDITTKPYLYYMNIINVPLVFKICIQNCFSDALIFDQVAIDFWREFENYRCVYQLEGVTGTATEKRFCPNVNVFNSTIYRRICIPMTEREYEYSKDTYRAVSGDKQIAEMFFIAIYLSWPYVLALSGIALLISVALWAIFYFFTQNICWMTCSLVILCNTGLCMVLFHEYNKIPPEYSVPKSTDVKTIQYNFLEDAITNRRILYVLAVILLFLLIIFFFVFIFLRKYFSEITLLLSETKNYWKQLKRLMIVPLISIFVIVFVFAIWSYVMLCLTTASFGKVFTTMSSEIIDKSFDRVEYVEDNNIRSLMWIYIVGFLWITEFVIAMEQFIVGVSIFHFYLQLPENTSVIYVFWQLLKHHLGTIAKGSFVFTFWKIPKLVILNGGKLVKKIISKTCTTHKLDWLEKTIGFLHPIAYTMVAMERIDLCPAGRETWKIMEKAPHLLRSINEMAIFMLFLLKLIVVFLTCIVGVFLLNDLKDVHLFIAPVLISTIFGYCFANIVFSFLEMILDTICVCVCEDKRINSHIGCWTKSNLALLLNQNRTDIQQSVVTIVKT